MTREEAETLVGTLIACVNEAHAAVSYEWRDACWKAADAAEERVVLALTGAQPAPSVPVDLITDYLVSISAHVAHQDDPKAQAEIGELLRMLAVIPEAKP